MYRSKCLGKEYHSRIVSDLIPSLLVLCKDRSEYSTRAPLILAILISDDEDLQMKVALESDALKRLADILEHPGPTQSDQFKEGALSCIASIGSIREECRKVIIETKGIVSNVVNCLRDDRIEIRLLACHCARVLSRSVKALRTVLIDSGIAEPLIAQMESSEPALQTASCAVLCNLVLEFSPMRKLIIDKNVLPILLRMVESKDHSIRVNALWALKNLSYQADTSTKSALINVFTYDIIYRYNSLIFDI
jgi:hypothetical protein